MSVRVQPDLLQALLEHGRRGYPEEICGALLGYVEGDARAIVRALPIDNQRATERATRYLIGPEDYRAADVEACAHGLDVIGFYHSHPDHPAVPSAFDREHAWPWYTYIIVPVHAGRPGVPRAWRLAEDRSRFDELPIEALDPTHAKEAS